MSKWEKFLKILVTGGAGYIGGTVALRLLAAGHNVLIYDNFCHGHRDLVPAGTHLIEGDIGDRERLIRVLRDEQVDGVMHFAALIEAGESMKHPEIYFRNNTASTLSLLEAMLATGVDRLVFSSTAAVYGEPKSTPIEEDAALAPTNPYGESKLLVEHMLTWMNRIHGLRYASLRYFNAAGASSKYGELHEPEIFLPWRELDLIRFSQGLPWDDSLVRLGLSFIDIADKALLALEQASEEHGSVKDGASGLLPHQVLWSLANLQAQGGTAGAIAGLRRDATNLIERIVRVLALRLAGTQRASNAPSAAAAIDPTAPTAATLDLKSECGNKLLPDLGRGG